jgi:hypothetical protein
MADSAGRASGAFARAPELLAQGNDIGKQAFFFRSPDRRAGPL